MRLHLTSVSLNPQRYPRRDCYPFNLPIFAQPQTLRFASPVTCFVGENGTGKSTLLRAMARACGIHLWRGDQRQRARPNPWEEELYRALDIVWRNGSVPGSVFSSEHFRDFAQLLDEWAADDPGALDYFGGRSLITQSHGQSLMSFFEARFRVKGLYFLDEPETALSPATQMQLLDLLKELMDEGKAQLILATHSPILMSCPGAALYSFDDVPIRPVRCEETTHYRVYRDFMRRPPSGG